MEQTKGYAFNEKRHIHTYDGKNLYGITSILKLWGDPGSLVSWAANQAIDAIERGESPEEARKAHLKIRDKAGDKGKQVHATLEDAMNQWMERGVAPTMDDEIVNKVLGWMTTEGYTPIKSEFNLYSTEMWTGGICDLIAEKEGKQYIMDFKTSGSVQTKYFYQMAAYNLMYREMYGKSADACVILHIPRGTSFNVDKNIYSRYDMENLEQAWLGILKTYKIDQELQKLIKY